MSTPRRPVAAARIALGLAGSVLIASGCSFTSPTTITTPYAAADGTNADLTIPGAGIVKFRNFLLVSAAQGDPGVLIGAVASEIGSPVTVQLSVLGADGRPIGQTTVTAKPGELTQVGPEGTSLQVSAVPLPPGSVLKLHAQTTAGGTDFSLPVLAPQNQYSSITPSANTPEVSTITAAPLGSPGGSSPTVGSAGTTPAKPTGSASPSKTR